MTLPRPTAGLLLEGGGSLVGSPLSPVQAGLRSLRVELSVDEAHDRVELELWRDSVLAAAEPGAVLSVGLGVGTGESDSVEDVLRVDVAGVDAGAWGASLVGYAPSRRLATAYVGRSYRDRTVGDIVGDLLDECGVPAGEIEAGVTLPIVHVDPRRSVWGTVHRLATRCGCQVTSAPDGAMGFTPVPGASGSGGLLGAAGAAASALGLAPSAELREGAELLGYRAGPRPAPTAQQVLSPVASRPALLLAEPDTGSGAPVVVDLLLRTREAAEAASAARAAAARRRTRLVHAVVPGRPTVRAGGTVSVRGATCRVVRVRHVLDVESGYTCHLALEAGT